MFGKKEVSNSFKVGDEFDPNQEVQIYLSAGELSLIHSLLAEKLEECEVLYKAGDRSQDTGLTAKFSIQSIEKIEPLLKPVAEWLHQQAHEHEHHNH